MKDIWVLSVRTSLPNACERFGDMKTEFFAFECFEDAKAAFREKIKNESGVKVCFGSVDVK